MAFFLVWPWIERLWTVLLLSNSVMICTLSWTNWHGARNLNTMATSSTFKKYTLKKKKKDMAFKQTDRRRRAGLWRVQWGSSIEHVSAQSGTKTRVSVFGGDEEMKYCQMSRVFSYRRFHFSLSVEIILSIFRSSKVSELHYRCYIPVPWLWLERFCRPVFRWLQKLFAALGLLFGLLKEQSVGFKGILNKNMCSIVTTYYWCDWFRFLKRKLRLIQFSLL